jgi:hypothetical protein
MDGTGENDVKWNKLDWERQIWNVLSHMQSLDLKKKNVMSVKRGGGEDCLVVGTSGRGGEGRVWRGGE